MPVGDRANVLDEAQVGKRRRNLKAAHEAQSGDVGRRHSRDVASPEEYGAGGRLQELRDQVEAGRLAGAVGPDQRVDGPAPDLKVHVIDGRKASELLGKSACLDYGIFGSAHGSSASKTMNGSSAKPP